ncbi:hypothetical protein BO443_60310 [Burkholderia orbicola]
MIPPFGNLVHTKRNLLVDINAPPFRAPHPKAAGTSPLLTLFANAYVCICVLELSGKMM